MTNAASSKGAVDQSPSKDEIQAEEEKHQPTVSKPGGFINDPNDPSNPNEVRERHLRNIDPKTSSPPSKPPR